MSGFALDAGWLAALHDRANQPPMRPRVPLWAGDARIGSVEPGLLAQIALPDRLVVEAIVAGERGRRVNGELTASLNVIALALRQAGAAHAWRDEQLAVVDDQGRRLGTVERAVVRPLGIATLAVHLVGVATDGRHWVQQRALTKPNDPGLWDTLMGGMVPASDSVEQALERETWEEAGLRLVQVEQLVRGGQVGTRRPTGDGRAGYVVEHIDWYRCVVPDGVVPVNQDGEVAQFRLMDRGQLRDCLQCDEFTTEAALIVSQFLV